MRSKNIINEESMIIKARHGDIAAHKMIYDLNIRYLTAVCSRYILNTEDVKDVLQDSFLKIFSSLRSFEYRGRGSLRSWMSRIVVNEALMFLKQSSNLEFSELTEAEESVSLEEPKVDDMPSQAIYDLIRQLPDGYRTIFNLYVIEEKSHKEIALLLGIKESSSASQLHRAKALLAASIKKYQSSLNQQ